MPRSKTTTRAQTLRASQTEAEGRLWGILRNRGLGGWKWKRQVPRGPYVVDFYCAEAGVIVELDGSQHHDPIAMVRDERRTAILESAGARVVGIPNNEVFTNLDGVCHALLIACGGPGEVADEQGALFGWSEVAAPPPHPTLSPAKSGGEGKE